MSEQRRNSGAATNDSYMLDGGRVGVAERDPWSLIERWCERYPHDWRLLFRRGDEVLEVSVPEEVWRAFDA